MAITTIPSSGTTDGTNLVLLSSVSASDNTEITFDSSLITDTYKTYFLTMSEIYLGTDSVNFRMRVSEDNGSNYISANYYKTTIYRASGDTNDGQPASKTGSKAEIQIAGDALSTGNASRETIASNVWLYNLRTSSRSKLFTINSIYEYNSDAGAWNIGSYALDDDAIINNIKIYPSSGDINSGIFSLYGVRT